MSSPTDSWRARVTWSLVALLASALVGGRPAWSDSSDAEVKAKRQFYRKAIDAATSGEAVFRTWERAKPDVRESFVVTVQALWA